MDIYGAAMGRIRGVSRPQPLAVAEIIAWCHQRGLHEDDCAFVTSLVREMDGAYLRLRAVQIKHDLDEFLSKK
ncbi:hypothetical protein ACMAUO_06170 [Gluconacetobacter sp. Hr-1-5]|uniref:hypothetical protein n=1 Tax=Gluconacetobacter sp. Hr-1-5 TaxID=3395370 RepID=UPI003B52470A